MIWETIACLLFSVPYHPFTPPYQHTFYTLSSFPPFLPQQPSPVVTLSQHLGGGHAQGLGLGSTGLNFEHEMDDVVMKSGDERIQTKASLTSVPSASGDMTGGTLPMMSISLPSSSTVGVLSPVLAGLLVKNNNSSSSSSSTGAT